MFFIKTMQSEYVIVLNRASCGVCKFAARELQKYIYRITGCLLPIKKDNSGKDVILLEYDNDLNDGYSIKIGNDKIILHGNNPRSVLYAVYGFLEDLGCNFIAPDFPYYKGRSEIIPKKEDIILSKSGKQEKPDFKYRRKDVGEGLTHTLSDIIAVVDWMTKNKMNVFHCPTDMHHRNVSVWDKWRKEVLPEIKKRGLLVEVGQHGYNNFLEEEKYFNSHPEWFGLDKNNKRSKYSEAEINFCTSNKDAVRVFTNNILDYLKKHPEIDIFDLWPIDSPKWCECEECKRIGDESIRHAYLVNYVAKEIKKKFPNILVECIAYQHYQFPPKNIRWEKNIILEYCDCNREYNSTLSNPKSKVNKEHKYALKSWLKSDLRKDIGCYTYYTKYAFKSLPVYLTSLISEEIKYYNSIGVNGFSSFSEPANWFTYEISHLFLAKLLWRASLKQNSFLDDYCKNRFGAAWLEAEKYFLSMEDIMRSIHLHMHYSLAYKYVPKLMLKRFVSRLNTLDELIAEIEKKTEKKNLFLVSKLKGSFQYAKLWGMLNYGILYKKDKRTFNKNKLVKTLNKIRDMFYKDNNSGSFMAMNWTGYGKGYYKMWFDEIKK